MKIHPEDNLQSNKAQPRKLTRLGNLVLGTFLTKDFQMKIDTCSARKSLDQIALLKNKKPKAFFKCLGYYDYYGEFDCGYQTSITCEDCKYGVCGGRKDPEAKCNSHFVRKNPV